MMDKSKLLALKLTALNENDFNWIYSRLAREVADELDPIIHEIKEIGFQVNQKDIDSLLEKKPVQQVENKSEAFQLIDSAAFDDIQKVFKSESSVLFNTLVDIGDWQWKNEKKCINASSLNGGIRVSNITSKKLLKLSMINATANILKTNATARDAPKKETSQVVTFALNVFGKLFGKMRDERFDKNYIIRG